MGVSSQNQTQCLVLQGWSWIFSVEIWSMDQDGVQPELVINDWLINQGVLVNEFLQETEICSKLYYIFFVDNRVCRKKSHLDSSLIYIPIVSVVWGDVHFDVIIIYLYQ
eukprot:TRINITY_DN1750_c0_g1_i9.p4 TRINITY_DN1750_c0_g1~~TRINITY_DN1750_c0_g1_i9.p4  ORF type:complete len:109 (-),score=1.74 TRINITY_DN1750_c0_g1_i9:217-543(-)